MKKVDKENEKNKKVSKNEVATKNEKVLKSKEISKNEGKLKSKRTENKGKVTKKPAEKPTGKTLFEFNLSKFVVIAILIVALVIGMFAKEKIGVLTGQNYSAGYEKI